MSYIQNFFTSRDNNANAETFVGQEGRLWWDPATNQIYSSDGNTPGGIPLAGGSGGATNKIYNGSSYANIATDSGNLVIGISGNTWTFGTDGTLSAPGNLSAVNLVINSISSDDSTFITIEDGVNVNGEISTTGNVTADYLFGNGSQLTGIAASYGNANVVANLAALGSNPVSTTGNVTGGNLLTAGYVSATGNVSGNFFIGNGSQLTGIAASYGNANVVANLAALGSNPVSTTGNVTGGNLNAAGLSLSSNVVSALNSSANITTTANIAGNYFIGNGSQLTGIAGGGGNYSNANVATFLADFGSNVISTTGNITGGNLNVTGNIVDTSALSIISGSNGNITLAPNGTGNVNISANVSVTGNIVTSGAVLLRVVSIADGVSITMNGDTTDIATQTNTQTAGTLTINAVTGTLFNGQKIILRLQSANAQTFSWNAIFAGSTDLSLPTTSSGSNKYDYVGFIYNTTATKWQLLAKNFGF